MSKMKESSNCMTREQLATEVKQRLETLPAIIPEIEDYCL